MVIKVQEKEEDIKTQQETTEIKVEKEIGEDDRKIKFLTLRKIMLIGE